MTPVATAWAIDGSDGRRLHVERDRDSDVVVEWLCGDRYDFDEDELAEAVANLELLIPHGVWMRVPGKDFVVKVVDGRLYGANDPTDELGPNVPWGELRDLLVPSPSPPEPEPEPARAAAFPPRRPGLLARVREYMRR